MFPAIARYDVQEWEKVETNPVRSTQHTYLSKIRCEELLEPLREQLEKYPLYVTLDKDVMNRSDCIQNWDSGYLTRNEVPPPPQSSIRANNLRQVFVILKTLIDMAKGKLLAIDVTGTSPHRLPPTHTCQGDWSEVQVNGCLRKVFHWTQHDEAKCKEHPLATETNQTTNLALIEFLHKALGIEHNYD